MSEPISKDAREVLDALACTMIRCFAVSVILLLLWFVLYLLGGDLFHSIHSKWFDISRHEFELIYYSAIGFVKVLSITLFLIPYVAIRWVLRGQGGAAQ